MNILFTLFIIIIILMISIVIFIWYKSKGKTTPILNKNSIASIEKITLGGVEQYIIVRGQDISNPIMLYLHGGPGFPEVALAKEHSQFLEENFVMVHWEQRGSGKSYIKKESEALNLERLILDTKDLTEQLIAKFHKDKIYILGHSWGTFLGILTVSRYPKLFHAYLGVGQVCNQYYAEKISLEWIKEEAKNREDKKALKKISTLKFPSKQATIKDWFDYVTPQRVFVLKYGGSVYQSTNIYTEMIKLLLAPEYTFIEKINFLRGTLLSFNKLWKSMIDTNLNDSIIKIDIPVYIFQGAYDYQTPTLVAKAFFEQLDAPIKEFYLFEKSAHSPHFEETERFNIIVSNILKES